MGHRQEARTPLKGRSEQRLTSGDFHPQTEVTHASNGNMVGWVLESWSQEDSERTGVKTDPCWAAGVGTLELSSQVPTFPEQHFRCDVIWGPDQGVGQAPLVLLPGSLLQGLQPVSTPTIRHVIPEVTGLHAVLPDVAPFHPGIMAAKEENTKRSELSAFNITTDDSFRRPSCWHPDRWPGGSVGQPTSWGRDTA